MWSELRRWPFEKRQPIKGMNKGELGVLMYCKVLQSDYISYRGRI